MPPDIPSWSAETHRSPLDYLIPALQRLDSLLERAVARMPSDGDDGHRNADPYRGLYISPDEVTHLIQRDPAGSMFAEDADATPLLPPTLVAASPLGRLQYTFGLSPFDLDLIIIALAPELDLRYERLYAYVQDDVTRKRPTMDLALNLLCSSANDKVERRAHFSPDAPLVQHGLLSLVPDPNQVHPPLLSHYLKLDEQVVRLLLGQMDIDRRLASFCRVPNASLSLAQLIVDESTKQVLAESWRDSGERGQPLKLYFWGPAGSGKRLTAEALAAEQGMRLIGADLAWARDDKPELESKLPLLFREARLQDAVLLVDGIDCLHPEGQSQPGSPLLDRLMQMVDTAPGIVILLGTRPLSTWYHGSPDIITVAFPMLDFAQRRDCWQAHLAAASIALEVQELDAVAGRFRLTAGQIAHAARAACAGARWQSAPESLGRSQPSFTELLAAARAQSTHELGSLSQKIEPKYGWEDIVLPPDQMAQLAEICSQVKYRHMVYDEWGFEQKLSLGKGLDVLFSGPPGTGKTMAAEVLANELHLDLYKIDLSLVVSKYIGETEKNLGRIFAQAETSNAILFFDEADALFGKRSEVKDAHDRYANIEIGYLLQKMEEYDGIVILATNLRKNVDEAFVRRMHYIVEFPFPDVQNRLAIWNKIFPDRTPLASSLNLDAMAHRFEITGGNIRNIALAAAFLAADDGKVVGMPHLIRATRREYQKMGKLVADGQFGEISKPTERPTVKS